MSERMLPTYIYMVTGVNSASIGKLASVNGVTEERPTYVHVAAGEKWQMLTLFESLSADDR
jgi:hypothetical protein